MLHVCKFILQDSKPRRYSKIVAKESTFTYLICKYVHPIQKHGCCPDGLKKARGPDFKGCENATPCKDASWGCCPDLVHPAHGPNQEGCCISSEFGCCPDNIKEATVSIFYDTEYHDPVKNISMPFQILEYDCRIQQIRVLIWRDAIVKILSSDVVRMM